MRKEFAVHKLNQAGLTAAADIGEIFSRAVIELETLVPPGREMAIVMTKLQEACFFAKRGIAINPAFQE